jgi:hypothetical protein
MHTTQKQFSLKRAVSEKQYPIIKLAAKRAGAVARWTLNSRPGFPT